MKKFTIFSKSNSMKLLVSAALIASCSSAGYAQITSPAPYCASVFSTNYNMFNNIKIKGTTLSFGAMGNWMPSGNNTYGYYNTTTFPNLKKSDTFSVQLNVYAVDDIEPSYFALWIDYNHNNTFDNTELVMENANTTMALLPPSPASAPVINKILTVPATATTGITRARLMRGTNSTNPFAAYSASFHLSPCTVATPDYGCTYDFNLNIVNGATGINEIGSNTTGLCYPNPASDVITVSLKGMTQEGIVTLYDLTGKSVKNTIYKNEEAKLFVSDVPNGIYYLKANSGNEVLTEKIVIAH
jgi:hypothetical protein